MKKSGLLLALSCALGLAMPASAQIRLGVIGGLNLANVVVEPAQDPQFSNLTAFGGGVVAQIHLTENLALQLEPMYLQKGARLEGSFNDTDSDSGLIFTANVKAKLNYLEVPAMLKFTIGTSTSRPYVMAGPMLGFRLSAREMGSFSISGLEQKFDLDVKDQTQSIDFGIGFGAGVNFPVGRNSIFIQGRYALGLTNISDDPDDPESKLKTRGIQVMAGLTFSVGQ